MNQSGTTNNLETGSTLSSVTNITAVTAEASPSGSSVQSTRQHDDQLVKARDTDHYRVDSHQRPHHDQHGEKCSKHVKGFLWLILLLVFQFVCLVGVISMGLGVGVLAAELHELCWSKPMDPFWDVYAMMIFVFASTQLYIRIVVDTTFSKWIQRKVVLHRIELFYVPRGLYLSLYIFAVVNLYLQYVAVHENVLVHLYETKNVSNTNQSSTNNSTSDPIENTLSTTTVDPNSLLSNVYDGHEHPTFFILSLAFMMYSVTKESDWITHQAIVKAEGGPDPTKYGNFGNLLILGVVHFMLTVIYALPLIGYAFMLFKFSTSAPVLYFTMMPIAVGIGGFGSFLERKNPFPISPMTGPVYAYENHLRARMTLIHYWLIPIAAGRFFNHNWAVKLDARNYDFMVFCVEVGIGIIHVSKSIGNDIYLYVTHWGFDVEIPPLTTIREVEDPYLPRTTTSNANATGGTSSVSDLHPISEVPSAQFTEIGNPSTVSVVNGEDNSGKESPGVEQYPDPGPALAHEIT